MTICVSIRRQSFNTHGHGNEHQVWTQSLPMLPCQQPQDMKFPWKNVTAVTAINPLGPPLCRGLAKTQGCLPGCESDPSCSQGREHRRCRGSSFHDLMCLRKPLWCDGVMRRSSSPRLPLFWEPQLSPLPAFREAEHDSWHSTAPACSFHWNPLLLAIYILFLERDRKPNESEPSMVTSAPALTRLSAVPVPWWRYLCLGSWGGAGGDQKNLCHTSWGSG